MRTSVNRRRAIRGCMAFAAMPAIRIAGARTSPNETINVACIGTGGRCRSLMKPLAGIPNVRIAAVCDVWDQALEQGRALADPKAATTKRYQDVLDSKDIDAVLIGTPDHWHVPLTIAACAAGKDVYVEKPLTHDLSEGHAVIAAQNQHGRIVQVGMQQRSMPHLIQARERIQGGRLGRVVKVRMSWNRNAGRVGAARPQVDPKSVDWNTFLGSARKQDFDPYRFRNWRWFWDFGGGIFTDLMVHWVDVAHWCLANDTPDVAVSLGEHLAGAGVWETPDTVQTIAQYPGGVQMQFEGTFSNAHNGARIEFLGTEATLYADRGRYEITPDRGRKGEPESLILGDGPKGADFYDQPEAERLHLINWIDCIRSRKAPNAPAEAGVAAAAAAHLANRALRTGQTAHRKSDEA